MYIYIVDSSTHTVAAAGKDDGMNSGFDVDVEDWKQHMEGFARGEGGAAWLAIVSSYCSTRHNNQL